ncbi:MAG: ABC transporter permease [Pirellulales bacterium]
MTRTTVDQPEDSAIREVEHLVEQVEDQPMTVIEPRPGWKALDLRELWPYRELIFFLAWRDIKVRYKQTVLGASWAILQPLALMVVFSAVLGREHAASPSIFPYPVFLYSGLLIWLFFSQAITAAGNSVLISRDMVTKVYFPRLTIPIASVGPAAIDFLIAMVLLIVMMAYYGIAPGESIVMLPILLLLAMMAALGVGAILAALNVAYRDFRYTLPFLVQIWMLATPSIYKDIYTVAEVEPAPNVAVADAGDGDTVVANRDAEAATEEEVPAAPPVRARSVSDWLELNPMTGLVGSFRAAVLGGPIPWSSLAYSATVIVVVFVTGCYYFRRSESSFADVI